MENLEITEKVRRSTISWLLTMQEEYGNEIAMKCYDVMREGFGEDLAGAVLFGIMSGNHGDSIRINWSLESLSVRTLNNKIQAIKAVRAISGLGLGEAKNAVEQAQFEAVQVKLLPEIEYTVIRSIISQMEEAGLYVR